MEYLADTVIIIRHIQPSPAGLLTGIEQGRSDWLSLFSGDCESAATITEKEFSETLTKRISHVFPIPRIRP